MRRILKSNFLKEGEIYTMYKAGAMGILKKMEAAVFGYFLWHYRNVYGMLFAKQRFGSNFKHAVHTGVDGNAVAPHCAVQQIGIPPLLAGGNGVRCGLM